MNQPIRDRGLTLRITPEGPMPRSVGPMRVNLRIDRQGGPRLLKGSLELRAEADGVPQYRLRLPPMALPRGQQNYRLSLPAVRGAGFGPSAVTLTCLLHPASGPAMRLGQTALRLPGPFDRSVSLALVRDGHFHDGQSLRLAQALDLAEVWPGDRDVVRRYGPQTSVHRLELGDLPANPLELCAYDGIVMQVTPTLSNLRPAQREALARWVRGGGNLCLRWGRRMADRSVATWLNDVCDRGLVFLSDGKRPRPITVGRSGDERPPLGSPATADEQIAWRFTVDQTDRLALERTKAEGQDEPAGLFVFACGLGRLLMVRDDRFDWGRAEAKRSADVASTWRRARGMFWRLNDPGAPAPAQGDLFGAPAAYPDGLRRLFKKEPREYLQALLMPRDFRFAPLWLLGLVLLGFLLLIGPVDYFGWGLLRRRWLTWLSLPIASALCTGVIIAVANAFSGYASDPMSLRIVDLDPDGKPLRFNEFHLQLSDANRAFTESHVRRLVSVLGEDHAAPAYRGDWPLRYERTQRLERWKPTLIRHFGFEPPEGWVGPGLDGRRISEAFERASAKETAQRGSKEWAQRIFQAVQQLHPDAERVRLLDWGFVGGAMPGQGHLVHRPDLRSDLRQVTIRRLGVANHRMDRHTSPSSGKGSGLFLAVSTVAPSGGWALEDLPVLDRRSKGECLVCVVVEEEGALSIYRVLLRSADWGMDPRPGSGR